MTHANSTPSTRAAAARAARTAMRNARLDRYRVLTREQGLPSSVARRILGISAATSSSYETELTGLTGLERRAARIAAYQELRAQGLSNADACRRLGIALDTGRLYHQAPALSEVT